MKDVGRKGRTYIAIDLKSFYASAECADRGLDPLTENLVVADESRTDKTICLAVSPSLRSFGIPGRARLFEVREKVRELNRARSRARGFAPFTGKSTDIVRLREDPSLEIDFLVAPPRMNLYMQKSAGIHEIYLRYAAPEDIVVYSIDEVFIDATDYLGMYGTDAEGLARRILEDVYSSTRITATCGIGTNLYLAKVAMDILAKHMEPDVNGVRIASLTEQSYRETLWSHTPLTDFWRVGKGYAERLSRLGLRTMGDIALFSSAAEGEDLLYDVFGVNAELLIDHAWGVEPCTVADIRAYRPERKSVGEGQVLSEPYPYDRMRIIVREMAENIALRLFENGLVTDRLVLTIGYDAENLTKDGGKAAYTGPVETDRYGRRVPKSGRGTEPLGRYTNSQKKIAAGAMKLLEQVADKRLTVRRLSITAASVLPETEAPEEELVPVQMDFFTDYEAIGKAKEAEEEELEKERRLQRARIRMREKYGKNAILKGSDYEEGATQRERNGRLGGHKAE